VQFAVTFLATGLADVTMLIAHHLADRSPPSWASAWSTSLAAGPGPGSWESVWAPGVQFWLHLRATCDDRPGEGAVHGASGPSGGFGDVGASGQADAASEETRSTTAPGRIRPGPRRLPARVPAHPGPSVPPRPAVPV